MDVPTKGRRLLRRAVLLAGAVVAVAAPAAAHAASTNAVVTGAGAFVRGDDVVSVTRLSTGNYEVIYNKDVTRCAHVAVAGETANSGSVTVRHTISTADRAGNPNGVFVNIQNGAGTNIDLPFHTTTTCGTRTQYAVVEANGALAHGSKVASVTKLNTGVYQVVFTRVVKNCGYEASIGNSGAGTAAPGAIEVDPRAGNTSGLFIVTRDTTGAEADRPFHVNVVCGTGKLIGVINADGTTFKGANVVSSQNLGTGSYEVVFNQIVSGCTFTAAIGTPTPSSLGATRIITTAGRAGNPSGVFLFIMDNAGNGVNAPFRLVATC